MPVFLISLKAGGVRLNLTAADTVIHYNPWWNPAAKLAQSIVSTDHEGNIKLSEDEWLGLFELSRDCRRPKTLRQYPYEKQTIPNRS